jgi:hypothetical protein
MEELAKQKHSTPENKVLKRTPVKKKKDEDEDEEE